MQRQHLVLLVHGIRDFARWTANVRPALEARGLIVEPTNYGRMNLLEFLAPIPLFRRIAAKKVLTQIRQARQNHPRAEVSVIAHSFGTYVISRLLKSEFDLALHRVIFCGSVVEYDFEFEQLKDRFTLPIMNDVGTADPWPAVAESVTFGYGSAGTFGFHRPGVYDRYHNDKSHGDFLTREFANAYWAPFLLNGVTVGASETSPEGAKDPPLWIRLISIVKVRYLAVAAILVLALLGVSRLVVVPSGEVAYSFGTNLYTYSYWYDPVRIMLEKVEERCSIQSRWLCAIAATLSGRDLAPIVEKNRDVLQVVSCDHFIIKKADPIRALQALAEQHPTCMSMSQGPTGWILRLRPEGLVAVPRPGKQDALLCGCTPEQVSAFKQAER